MSNHLLESSNLYYCSIIIIIIFLISIIIPASYCAPDEQFMYCSGHSYNCGSIRGIGYPFWGGDRPDFCGHPHPAFYLWCHHDQFTTIKSTTILTPQTYRVLKMDQSSSTMTIALEDLWEDICPKEFISTTLDDNLFHYAQTLVYLNLFYGCISEPNVTELGTVHTENVTCPIIDHGGNGVVYGFSRFGHPDIALSIEGCNISILAQFSRTAYDELRDGKLTLHQALNQGFDVGYATSAVYSAGDVAACSACESSGGMCGSNSTQQFVCLCPDGPQPIACPKYAHGTNHFLKLLIGSSAAGIAILISAIICCCRFKKISYESILCWIKKKKTDQSLEELIRHYGSLAPKRYSYSEVKNMTNSFKNKLGQGGYGSVYKGNLLDGRLVAVKLLNASKANGEEFINEVASIGRTSHVNIITLLGFCLEGSKRALIYEFMANGSLEKFIYGERPLNSVGHLGWKKIYQIAIGIARGLEYLHRGCNTRILHFDIKPHNILLCEDFCPKISDFGLAKLCTRKESIVSMLGARGTIGYIAPELVSRTFGAVSHKSDVYSYGMMVLEIVGGRKNVDPGASHTSEIYFPYWVYKRLELNDYLGLQDEMSKEDNEIAKKMMIVGLWCIQTNPSQRPLMSNVIDMLEGSMEALELPPKPFLCSPERQSVSYLTT